MNAFASLSDQVYCGTEPATTPPAEDVTTLTLAILDGVATEAECHRLSELVASNHECIEVVQLVADLQRYFCPQMTQR